MKEASASMEIVMSQRDADNVDARAGILVQYGALSLREAVWMKWYVYPCIIASSQSVKRVWGVLRKRTYRKDSDLAFLTRPCRGLSMLHSPD